MKKREIILTLTAVVIIVVCLFVVSILENKELDDIKKIYSDHIKKEEYVSNEKENINNNSLEETNFVEEASTRMMVKRQFEKYVFVGDSRYKGMSIMADEKDVFICEKGKGYSFLEEQTNNIVYECDENTALIIGLGVNDNISNAEKYISKLNEMADYMDCQIYYMLVNPVDEEKEQYNGYSVLNENIDIFNDKIKEGLDEEIGIIDTNSYLIHAGYETQDGLHYTNETYEKIYNYIKSEIT